MMTNAEFVRHSGRWCPNCSGDNVSHEDSDTNADGILEEFCLCNDCSWTWWTKVQLVGYHRVYDDEDQERRAPTDVTYVLRGGQATPSSADGTYEVFS